MREINNGKEKIVDASKELDEVLKQLKNTQDNIYIYLGFAHGFQKTQAGHAQGLKPS